MRYNIFSLISYGILMIILILACIEDVKTKTISNKLIIFSLIIGITMVFINPDINCKQAILGGLVAFLSLWVISFLSKGDLGMGDVKLFATVGLYIGLEKVMQAMFYSAILSGIVGVILLIKSVSNKNKAMPFAPFVLIGVLVALVF
jgi:prepilin signal peptidase PulO-like enzyme (type II secretory pathway)